MILVYPMLTSDSVNPTLLPGIIKAIEKYIIIHNTDDVLKHFNSVLSDVIKAGTTGATIAAASIATAYIGKKMAGGSTLRIKKKGKKLTTEWVHQEQRLPANMTSKLQQIKGKAQSAAPDVEKGFQKGIDTLKDPKNKPGVTGFEMPRYDAVSLEPTWVQVQTNQGARLIGVKVVPFKVKSTTGMVGLMMDDTQLKKMSYLSNKMGRMAMRVVFRAMRGLKVPGFKDKVITGNPKTDIVWATSQYGKNTFVCFSHLDIEQDEFFSSPTVVQRLHKLGWASIIVTDDVNKEATFCMKQFGGVCSKIPYNFIFASLGKEHSQVYKDLEDASRSAGPFFRKKSTTRRKVFSK